MIQMPLRRAFHGIYPLRVLLFPPSVRSPSVCRPDSDDEAPLLLLRSARTSSFSVPAANWLRYNLVRLCAKTYVGAQDAWVPPVLHTTGGYTLCPLEH